MPDNSPRDGRHFTFYSFRLFKSQVSTCIYWGHSARVVCRVGACDVVGMCTCGCCVAVGVEWV